ncbi:hypothetical protein CHLNCDRAFT_36320 [Chlorella variabilis]|uniref:Uncharacterized protein n=1 Tax=Chlorella variabilis TaxID=554065 RepID=E1ZK84_CHLVA|nr:hypothetical protein CHLNCDRAFT_36320 [Chlorella variabilis]EFN53649.1 hypothetical protein CHLNCDRAFT_36320 [Chlorella variabilis]|eukprot:XP_005845751.1 hypothetical protein CHLNCDRAFT_36320 [Chlorella variabilis]
MSKIVTLPPPPPKRRRLAPPIATNQQEPAETPAGHADTASFEHDFAAEPAAPEALPNDALVALQLLNSRFPAVAGVAPFATCAQLYSVLADRTAADRQLEELRRSNTVRLLQLPASRDECVVMLTADYVAAVQRCKEELAARSQQQQQQQQQPHGGGGGGDRNAAGHAAGALEAFAWFAERVLPACTEVMVTHGELLQLLSGAPPARPGQPRRQADAAGAAAGEPHVSLLLSQGLLTRHTGGPDGYLFSMPNAGAAVRSVAAGRQEILSLLQRRRQPELLEAELLKRKLQRSVLGVRWHVTDMVGGGALLRIPTAVGPLLRAAKRGG